MTPETPLDLFKEKKKLVSVSVVIWFVIGMNQ